MLQKMELNEQVDEQGLFRPGENCWRVDRAYHANVIVDYSFYYKALAESLLRAKHSIFLTGWDIDSRIDLIRDDEQEEKINLYKILIQKARENPDLQIYLNRWNYAFFMAGTREPMAVWKWRWSMLPNIHYVHDNMTPVGACHHQKVVVIDDEVAFTGGMDVSFGRWDKRSHHPHNEKRVDPGGVYNPTAKIEYPAYHDIQTVMSGPIVKGLAELSRFRWRLAAGYDAVPMRNVVSKKIPQAWPPSRDINFEDIDVAIARTIPDYANLDPAYEIEKMYIDEIGRAENFIYMENQYFTRMSIARALRKQMQQKPDLRLLLVSSDNPQGFFEKVTMWTGRMKFKKYLQRDYYKRVCMAYPVSRGDGKDKKPVRIHSKFMVVDDRLMHIGSANINNRSMRMDTECDIVYAGNNAHNRKKIADIRNDLIREHTGMELNEIQSIINKGESPHRFLEVVEGSRQSLSKLRDGRFFGGKKPSDLPTKLGDSEKGWLPSLPLPGKDESTVRYFPRKTIFALLGLFMILATGFYARSAGWMPSIATEEGLTRTLEDVRGQEGAILTSIGIYVLASYFFVPVTLLTGVVSVIFGYWSALLICVVGSITSAILGYGTGRLAGKDRFNLFAGKTMEKLKTHAQNSNIISITFLRMIPIAPFSVVNMSLGIVKVPFLVFMGGSLLGMVPGKFVTVFVAGSIGDLWLNPQPEKILIAGLGIIAWVCLVWGTHRVHAYWKAQKENSEE